MGVGIELDTENSIRKYQVCKPVTPQKTSAEAIQLRFFRYCSPTISLKRSTILSEIWVSPYACVRSARWARME